MGIMRNGLENKKGNKKTMAKDPAFLFYYQDFLVGVDHMTDEQIGQYIKCLCHQANRGSIRESHMKNICKTHENHMIVKEKFQKGKDGNYFNKRLALEVEKRKNYTESRRNNRSNPNNISSSYVPHMEDENENVNEKEDKKENDFKYLNNPTFKNIYTDYMDMRKTIRKPATEKAKKMALTLLHKQTLETAIKMLEQSVMNSWQGIFPLKQDKFNQQEPTRPKEEYKHFEEQSSEEQKKVMKLISKTVDDM